MFIFDICIVQLRTIRTKEHNMKQWISAHILSAEELRLEENIPISNQEFFLSLSLVGIALAFFGIIIRVFGA